MDAKHWSNEERAFLRKHYKNKNLSANNIVDMLNSRFFNNRSLLSIYTKAQMLGLTRKLKKWTQAEKDFLKENYPLHQKKLKMPGRSKKDIEYMATKLKLIHPPNFWKPEEIKVIKNNIDMPEHELVKLLPKRTLKAIQIFKTRNGLYKPKKAWTEKENKILQKNYIKLGKKIMKLLPNRTWDAVRIQANSLNLYLRKVKTND